MKHHKYTKEQLINAIQNSTSKRQALLKLNIAAQGGNYRVINKAIQLYKLDTSHFKGQGWNKDLKIGPKIPLSEYLNNSKTILSHKLKLRLIREKYFPHKCQQCKRSTWNKKLIPLELDHINGNHVDNKITNLRLLCPNCHAQTSTYRGKNKNSKFSSALPVKDSPTLTPSTR